jgi:CelD/BcsL family acetyltransferase involved in cellulose biosynthesis
MIQSFEIAEFYDASRYPARASVPARILMTNDIRDLAGFWPHSDRLGEARCYPFQCYEILELQCATIVRARNAAPVFVAVLGQSDELLALIPLIIESKSEFTRAFRKLRVLRFVDGGLSDYNAPVVFPAVRDWDGELVRTIWSTLKKHLPPFDVAVLEKMPDRVGDLPNPLSFLKTSVHRVSGHATTLSGTWQDFAVKLPNWRNLRRLGRRLGELGALKFEIAETPEQYDVSVEALIRHKRRRSLETRGYDSLDRPGVRSYFSNARNLLYPSGPVCAFALKLDDRVVAAQFDCIVGSRLVGQICSFDAEWRTYSPGRLLLERKMEWCFSNGIDVFDFGIGDESYKNFYCDSVIALSDAVIPGSAKGWCVLTGRDSYRKLREAWRSRRLALSEPLPAILEISSPAAEFAIGSDQPERSKAEAARK